MGREFFSSRENNTYNQIYFYLLETSSKSDKKTKCYKNSDGMHHGKT